MDYSTFVQRLERVMSMCVARAAALMKVVETLDSTEM